MFVLIELSVYRAVCIYKCIYMYMYVFYCVSITSYKYVRVRVQTRVIACNSLTRL